jgi:hypothetical protein
MGTCQNGTIFKDQKVIFNILLLLKTKQRVTSCHENK